MIKIANAKINIGLNIINKRADNYHNISSIMYPIPLSDILEIVSNIDGSVNFTQTGILVPDNKENNLCVKAYNLLAKHYNIGGVNIYLHKKIPVGAGLGGGSSDAANSIVLLDKLFKLNLSIEQMMDYSSELGADCPFFIRNQAAYIYNTGTQMYNIDLSMQNFNILIVKPNISISTKEAYSGVNISGKTINVEKIKRSNIAEWKNYLSNDFEIEIFRNHPYLSTLKQKFYSSGALFSSMSGSGSAVFALFDKEIPFTKADFPEDFFWKAEFNL